jgi:hypothetical protein
MNSMDDSCALLRAMELEDLEQLRGDPRMCRFLRFHEDSAGITLAMPVLHKDTTVRHIVLHTSCVILPLCS